MCANEHSVRMVKWTRMLGGRIFRLRDVDEGGYCICIHWCLGKELRSGVRGARMVGLNVALYPAITILLTSCLSSGLLPRE
jgi:hypothetical protein